MADRRFYSRFKMVSIQWEHMMALMNVLKSSHCLKSIYAPRKKNRSILKSG